MAEQATQTSERPSSAAPVLVVNSRKGISLYILASKGKLEDGSEGTLHQPMRLMPGANRIPADQWKAFAKECKPDLDKGLIRVMDRSLKSYEEGDAIGIVKSTIDKSLLKAFLAVDSRAAVRKAITRQLAEVTGKPVEDDDEELSN